MKNAAIKKTAEFVYAQFVEAAAHPCRQVEKMGHWRVLDEMKANGLIKDWKPWSGVEF